MAKQTFIKSKGLPFSRVFKVGKGKSAIYSEVSISKEMADKGIPVPIPDGSVDFFGNYKTLIEFVVDGDAAEKKYNDYMAERKKKLEAEAVEKSHMTKASIEMVKSMQKTFVESVGKKRKEVAE